MQKREKSGQLQLSFGMIFSIIIIVATIAVAFYFITKVFSAQECTKIELFKRDLQDSINKVWRSPFGQEPFTSALPSGVTKVCIGDVAMAGTVYTKVLESLDPYLDPNENLFFYPPKEACKGSLASTKLSNLKPNFFSCFDVVKGKASFKISKGSNETLVSIQK